MSALDYDYAIIGSGFGGSACALRLCEKGYRVLMLEKGSELVARDFPKSNWDLARWLWAPALGFRGLFQIRPGESSSRALSLRRARALQLFARRRARARSERRPWQE